MGVKCLVFGYQHKQGNGSRLKEGVFDSEKLPARWWKVPGRLKESRPVHWRSPLGDPCTKGTESALPRLLPQGLLLTCSKGEQKPSHTLNARAADWDGLGLRSPC